MESLQAVSLQVVLLERDCDPPMFVARDLGVLFLLGELLTCDEMVFEGRLLTALVVVRTF